MYLYRSTFPIQALDDEILAMTAEIRRDCELSGYDPESLHRAIRIGYTPVHVIRFEWTTDVPLR